MSPKEEWAAIALASGWVYLGPCRGDSRKLELSHQTINIVMSIDYGTPIGGAILEMIAVMAIADFGRKPSEITCEYALKRAQSNYKLNLPR